MDNWMVTARQSSLFTSTIYYKLVGWMELNGTVNTVQVISCLSGRTIWSIL